MQTDHGFVPDDLVLLVDFLNSTYPGTVDELGSTERFTAWLAGHGHPAAVTAGQLVTARRLRDGLRAAAAGNAGVETAEAALVAGDHALARTVVRVSLLDGGGALVAGGSGADGFLGRVAVTFAAARLTGRWPRVKGCAGEDCGFVFWDDSRNGSRKWCDMQRCGSRHKMRIYRARIEARSRPAEVGPARPGTESGRIWDPLSIRASPVRLMGDRPQRRKP